MGVRMWEVSVCGVCGGGVLTPNAGAAGGFDATSLVSNALHQHFTADADRACSVGLDAKRGRVCDMHRDCAVYEVAAVTRSLLRSAVEVALAILNIDDIVYIEPRLSPEEQGLV